MEVLPKNVILQYIPDTLNAVRKIHGLNEKDKMKQSVYILDEWVQNQQHFVKRNFSRHYLETTIVSSKGFLDRAKKRLENLHRIRQQQPQFFGNFHIIEDFKEFHGNMSYAILPRPTKEYNRILLIKNTGKHFQTDLILQFARICIILFEYLKVHDYSDGVVVIVDLTQVSLMEVVRRINLQDLRQASSILIEGYGVRVKGLHVISTSKVINALVWLFKQVLSAKLVSRIHVHRSTKTLHNFVQKDVLPIEYDGKEKSLSSIYEQWLKELSSQEFRHYLADINKVQEKNETIMNKSP